MSDQPLIGNQGIMDEEETENDKRNTRADNDVTGDALYVLVNKFIEIIKILHCEISQKTKHDLKRNNRRGQQKQQ
jgi:hypothetical protein